MQSRSLEKKPVKSTDSFKQIYAIAKESKINKEEASKKLAKFLENACIDEVDSGDDTPAGRLAEEGDTEAASFLMKLGASINKIARGAALGGHHQYAEYLNKYYGASIHQIACGAAEGGHHEYAEKLRLKYKVRVNAIAEYAAKGGHKNYAEYLHKMGASRNVIARGAASGCHRKYIELFLSESNVQLIAEQVAFGGDHEYLKSLLENYDLEVHTIAFYSACGGHREYSERLRLNHGAQVTSIACGAAQGGHREYAEYFRQNFGVNINLIAKGAATKGRIEYAEYLRLNFKVDVKQMAEGASGGGDLDYLEHLYRKCKAEAKSILNEASNCNPTNSKLALQSLSNNDEFRVGYDKVTKQAQVSKPKITKLIQKAQKISSLKDKYNFDQCFALGQPELCVWYLDCFELVRARKITFNLFASIGIYLSPLTYQDSKVLCSTLRFDMYQKFLVKDINLYCDSKRWFGLFGGDEKADTFFVACTNAKTTEQLRPLLEKEMKQDNKDAKAQPQDNSFKDLLVRHYKRFS